MALVLVGPLACAIPARCQVTYERILNAAREPGNWLTYSGDHKSWRYSILEQINLSNVGCLATQWVFQSAGLGQFENHPAGDRWRSLRHGTGQPRIRSGRTHTTCYLALPAPSAGEKSRLAAAW